MPDLMPRTKAPELAVETLNGGWKLSEQSPKNFTMMVFYRGLHCPICEGYLQSLHKRLDECQEKSLSVIAVSADPKDRAEKTREQWNLPNLELGYGLTEEQMRTWGLFLSEAIKEEETPLFCEPGLFLIRPDQTIYYEAVNSMPFGRPQFAEVLKTLDFLMQMDYPARGEA